jgi:CheY-like chemotaxis protein
MGKRILVADDSRTIQQAFAMVMDGSGYTLSFARSVDEALSVAKRDGRPDLVLSDAVLGSGSGYDLCAQLKADASLQDVPVYILASLQTPYDEARGRKVGADGHLAKPFESQALLDAVASALTTPARRPSGPRAAPGIDFGTTPSRYAEDEVVGEDEDSYGEITIERGPAPSPSAWATRPPSRPSAARPLPLAATPAAPVQAAPRPPMIGGPRPTTGVPATRTGATPPPMPGLPPAPAAPQPRQPARTMMGFPSPKSASGPRPAGFPAPIAPPVVAPSMPAPSRPATIPPATTLPGRPPTFPPPSAPLVARPAPTGLTLPGPVPGAPVRPVPRFTPPPAASVPPMAPVQPSQPVTHRTLTPPPPAAEPPQAPTAIAAAVASVADRIDQKVAALAERGPEYEAIAKLSREIIEQVVWEVVPELAEAIIRQEVDRLASAKK